MEAMAAGLPIVSTRAGGVPELLTHGREGLLVDTGDLDAFARALVTMNQPELRLSLGTAAARRARQEFAVEAMISAYEVLYDDLITGKMPVRLPAAV